MSKRRDAERRRVELGKFSTILGRGSGAQFPLKSSSVTEPNKATLIIAPGANKLRVTASLSNSTAPSGLTQIQDVFFSNLKQDDCPDEGIGFLDMSVEMGNGTWAKHLQISFEAPPSFETAHIELYEVTVE